MTWIWVWVKVQKIWKPSLGCDSTSFWWILLKIVLNDNAWVSQWRESVIGDLYKATELVQKSVLSWRVLYLQHHQHEHSDCRHLPPVIVRPEVIIKIREGFFGNQKQRGVYSTLTSCLLLTLILLLRSNAWYGSRSCSGMPLPRCKATRDCEWLNECIRRGR